MFGHTLKKRFTSFAMFNQQFLSYNSIMKPQNFRDTLSSCQYCHHKTINILHNELARHSYTTAATIPLCLRDSLVRNSRRPSTMSAQTAEHLASFLKSEMCEYQKSKTASFKQSLNALQQKISKAKKSLRKFSNSQVSEESDQESDQKILKYLKDDNKYEDTTTVQNSLDKVTITSSQITVSSYPQIKTYYLTNLQSAFQGKNSRALEHLKLSLKILRNQSKVETPTFSRIQKHKVNLVQEKGDMSKKTLLLDIDETLLHSQKDNSKPYDIALPVQLQSGNKAVAYISIRPYAISFLKKMSKLFEIIAFTASHQHYADVILDQIDPERQYIKHRLYRKNCIQIYQKIYAKDLRIVNRDLSSLVLVDNAPFSYIYQLQNGIPIVPYYGGEDNELIQLEKYLDQVAKCADVRELNKKTFKLHQYNNFTDIEELVKNLYLKQL